MREERQGRERQGKEEGRKREEGGTAEKGGEGEEENLAPTVISKSRRICVASRGNDVDRLRELTV